LIKILIQNVGAQVGFLILEEAGELLVEAEGTLDGEVTVLQSMPIEFVKPDGKIPLLSSAIVNYVIRTRESVVLNDATREGQFINEEYIKKYKPKSILCAPLMYQGQLGGVVYLENNLTFGAFTPERLEVLQLLSGQAAIAIANAKLFSQVCKSECQLEQANAQLEEYSQTLEQKVEQRTAQLKAAQKQIIAKEKLSSLGALTAGVAHEIRNPLNFVNNYAEGSVELTEELLEEIDNQAEHLDADTLDYIKQMLIDIRDNAAAIHQHGQRAEGIISSMMQHARTDGSQRQSTDLNALLDQAVQLAYHSRRASDSSFNAIICTDYDDTIGRLEVVSSDLNRAFINLIDNACYAVFNKQKSYQQHSLEQEAYAPKLWLKTQNLGEAVEIRIRDNGMGIPREAREKIFHPFFTTKPTGEGTGLGLSLTHDIIVGQHDGTLKVETEPGAYTEFIISLPKA
jgi:signal transduction histidine kinase